MLKHLPAINDTVKGLGVIVENQGAVLRFFVRNWPVTLLAGTALGARLLQRRRQKELTPYNVVVDVGTIVGPVASIFLLVKLAQESEQESASASQLATMMQQMQQNEYQTPHATEIPIVRKIA